MRGTNVKNPSSDFENNIIMCSGERGLNQFTTDEKWAHEGAQEEAYANCATSRLVTLKHPCKSMLV
jgi:hypothetical protein